MSDMTIMIVDDDSDLVLSLTPRLKGNGYKVVSAADTASAIAMAQKEAPDLVILDLQFPGSDGIMFLRQMRELTDLTSTPVIVLTGREQAADAKNARDAGATAFFVKPPNNQEFLAAIREVLGETSNLLTSVKP